MQEPSTQTNVIKEIDDKYLSLIHSNEEKKKDIIRKYAEELEVKAEMPLTEISKHLTEKLKDYANKDYIRRCLNDEHKDPEQQRRSRAGRPKSARVKKEKICPHCHLLPSEEPKQESDELWQIDPATYKIDDVDHYDLVFSHNLIRWMHGRITELEKMLHMKPNIKGKVKAKSKTSDKMPLAKEKRDLLMGMMDYRNELRKGGNK